MEKELHNESPEIEDAAFAAGFDGSEVEAVELQQEEPEETTKPEEAQGAEQEEPPQVEEEKPLTRAELKALADRAEALEAQLTKVHDRAFGKIGELQQRIEAIKTKTTGLSPKARERLSEEYPELAEMLFDAGGEDTAPVAPLPPQEDVLQKLREEQEQERRAIEKKLLRRDHKDWEAVVASTEFRGWVGTLPAEDQQDLASSWDADFVSEKITAFKEWKQQQAKPEQPPEQKQTGKSKRLENAVTPRGVPTNKPPGYDIDDEEAAMREAFGG